MKPPRLAAFYPTIFLCLRNTRNFILVSSNLRVFVATFSETARDDRALRSLVAAPQFHDALSEPTAQRRDNGCFSDLEAVIRKLEVKNEGHCPYPCCAAA